MPMCASSLTSQHSRETATSRPKPSSWKETHQNNPTKIHKSIPSGKLTWHWKKYPCSIGSASTQSKGPFSIADRYVSWSQNVGIHPRKLTAGYPKMMVFWKWCLLETWGYTWIFLDIPISLKILWWFLDIQFVKFLVFFGWFQSTNRPTVSHHQQHLVWPPTSAGVPPWPCTKETTTCTPRRWRVATRNPVRKPVEVGSLSCYLQGFSTIPGGCSGFLNNQTVWWLSTRLILMLNWSQTGFHLVKDQ